MRAIQIASLDGPEAAKLVEIDEPTDDGAVVIDVHAAGVAFPDALQSRGLYQYKAELPFVPGAEIAGVVRSAPVRSACRGGDRVAGLTMLYGGDGRSRCAATGIRVQAARLRCLSRPARACCSTT